MPFPPPEVDEDSDDNGTEEWQPRKQKPKQRYPQQRQDGDSDGEKKEKEKSGAWPRIERINTNTGIRRFRPPHSLQRQESDLAYDSDSHSDSDNAGAEIGAKPSRQTTPFPFPFTKEGSPAIVTLPNNLGPVHPKPTILEILRTRICTPGTVFLVEKIEDMPLYLPGLSSSPDSESEDDGQDEEEVPRPRRTINNLAEIIRREELERRKKEGLERKRRKARHRMVRLLLGDGEVCIQALLRPEKFGILDGGLVYEGCYVRLGNFGIMEADVDLAGGLVGGQEKKKGRLDREDDLFGDPALAEESMRASRKAGRQREKEKQGQKMYYLVVGDMVTVGWNNVYLGMLRDQEVAGQKNETEVVTVRDGKVTGPAVFSPKPEKTDRDVTTHSALPPETVTDEYITDRAAPCTTSPKPKTAISQPGTPRRDAMSHHYFAKTPGSGHGKHDMSPRKFLLSQATPQPSPSKPKSTTTSAIPSAKLNTDDIEEYILDNDLDDEAFEKLDISLDRIAERRHAPASTKPISAAGGGPFQELQAAVIEQNKANARVPSRGPALALAITDPSQSLKLTPLRSIPNLPYKQNWMVNVLAVVVSLSPVEPAHLPPYTQRTARLADPSTSKRVLLTVFLDPEEFSPEVGSVVLLVGVKNHRFDGGCLKKYASDRPKDTGNGNGMCRWWLENPRGLEWCAEEVDQLMSWWTEQDRQQQQEVGGGLDSMQIG